MTYTDNETLYILAKHFPPEGKARENNMVRVKTTDTDTVMWVSKDEVVKRKEAHWIGDELDFFYCSNCKWDWDSSDYVTRYCPNCGAKMTGKEAMKHDSKNIQEGD